MTSDERLGTLYAAIRALGFPALVMGGHAVRFYGVDRTTLDYDLHVVVDDETWSRFGDDLQRSPLFASAPPVEGPSWRPAEFKRFIIGALGDGREERLEFWRKNHLLASFDEMWARRSEGDCSGHIVAFLGLGDLIRSKETERDDDWRDVALLEEIADERAILTARDRPGAVEALARLRSRRGYDRAERSGLLSDTANLEEAWRRASTPITLAYLAPSIAADAPASVSVWPQAIQELLAGPLRRTPAGSIRHHALVEAMRRLYRRRAMAADRADKERASRPTQRDD